MCVCVVGDIDVWYMSHHWDIFIAPLPRERERAVERAVERGKEGVSGLLCVRVGREGLMRISLCGQTLALLAV